MYSRLTVPLVCAAVIVFACGLPNRSMSRTPLSLRAAEPVAVATLAASAPLASHRRRADTVGVDAGFDVTADERGVRLALKVVNLTPRKLEIDFPDGRTRDFVVLDGVGREVWRWSQGRLFTQTVQNKFLAAHDTAVYQERWAAPRPGQYTAVAILRSRNFPVERRVAFTVGPTTVAAAPTR
jgi:hypothetical protein